MFLYNLKLNENKLFKFLFLFIFIIVLFILVIGIYKIFFNPHFSDNAEKSAVILEDTIKTDEIFEITPHNYATILQTVTSDIDSYVGAKIHFVGYVYRLIDFNENEFVLARDMKVNQNSNQTLVIGFFSEYENAKDFKEGTWVDVTGKIIKGDYYGDIAKIKVTNIFETNEPDIKIADPPDKTYIPTSSMF